MEAENADNKKAEERRSYFRVDDVISVVVNPVEIDKESREKFLKSATSSTAFSLMSQQRPPEISTEGDDPDIPSNQKLYDLIAEIKTKLDFIINHFMLEKEGLLSSEKKLVNISASGLRFSVGHAVKTGDVLEIKLLLPTYPPVAVFAYGEVKRVEALSDGKFEVAVEYLNMGEPVRNEIIQYTLSRQRETIRRLRESGANE